MLLLIIAPFVDSSRWLIAAIAMSTMRFLFHFAHEHLDFRIAELSSVFGIFNLNVQVPEHNVNNPFVTINLPSEEDAKKIASRSILVRSVYRLWASGTSQNDLQSKLRQLPKSFLDPYIKSTDSYRYTVSSFNKTLTNAEKVKRIKALPFDILDFKGKVDLQNATHNYCLIEHYGAFGTTPSQDPLEVYFAKWVADGQRDLVRVYDVKKRHFIANTSMDAGLSFIMTNLGQVKKNMLVFDPFVGSGSLLVSSAHFGAYVMGTDIDYMLLHAKARPSRCNEKKRAADESIFSNLHQYGTEHLYIDALVADSSRDNMWRDQTLFDAIITDPPYGIREGAKKVGTDEENVYIDEELKTSGNHFPKRLNYHLSEIFIDLLNFAAKYLHKHGRLVFWFPVSVQEYCEENLPHHPCLRLVHNCEQQLNTRISRRLITMEKVLDFKPGMGSADVKLDHFEESTFREMYFSESKLQKERATGVSTATKQLEDLDLDVT